MGIKQKFKEIYSIHPSIANIMRIIYNAVNFNKINIEVGNNTVITDPCFMKNTRINILGRNNKVEFDEDVVLKNCSVFISGNNNTVLVGSNCRLNNCVFWIEDDNNVISIGGNTTIHGSTQLACIEGCKIQIGCDCMFSSDISFRTGDSHSITDANGKRINDAKSIVIGNHVWIGTKTILNKGSCILNNSIIGAGSVVTRAFKDENVIVAGNPAKIIKTNINWKRERV